jgi:hypothetical protein
MSEHKNDYSVIVFFDNEKPKKWQYVNKLNGLAMFLNNKHSSWTYFNVYDRRKGIYLKRFHKKEFIPPFI